MQRAAGKSSISWDPEKSGVRTLVSRLIEMGEVTIHEQPIALADISPLIEAQNSAHLFRKAGPEQHEVIAAMSSSRKRLAIAFGFAEEKMREIYLASVARGEKLPCSFAVDVHPLYTMAAGSRSIGLEIEALRDQGLVDRLEDGDYYLKK